MAANFGGGVYVVVAAVLLCHTVQVYSTTEKGLRSRLGGDIVRSRTRRQSCVEFRESIGEPECGLHALCQYTFDASKCICESRYTGDGFNCTLIQCPDPFLTIPLSNGVIRRDGSSTHISPIGDTVRIFCNSGYDHRDPQRVFSRCQSDATWSQTTPECIDIDECAEGTDTCTGVHGEHATCSNTVGSYQCGCTLGYRIDSNGSNGCQSITCSRNVTVPNGRVFHTSLQQHVPFGEQRNVLCNRGYHLSPPHSTSVCQLNSTWSDLVCEDDNECLRNTHSCTSTQKCVNTIGGYRCQPKATAPSTASGIGDNNSIVILVEEDDNDKEVGDSVPAGRSSTTWWAIAIGTGIPVALAIGVAVGCYVNAKAARQRASRQAAHHASPNWSSIQTMDTAHTTVSPLGSHRMTPDVPYIQTIAGPVPVSNIDMYSVKEGNSSMPHRLSVSDTSVHTTSAPRSFPHSSEC